MLEWHRAMTPSLLFPKCVAIGARSISEYYRWDVYKQRFGVVNLRAGTAANLTYRPRRRRCRLRPANDM